ncbi:MAG TPA: HhH-GPD-type base excision DNA repair protein [Euzebyales bacterium]|nr:HhH-GPD-type base excision DNA repair protein [Euzebyales bacterium]
MATVTRLSFTGDGDADDFISTRPLALLIGMLLDHQIPIERAFAAPFQLSRRLPVDFAAEAIAWMPPSELEACFRQPPVLHRYPAMMARQVQALCAYIAEHHHGDATAIWTDTEDGGELLRSISALPGFDDRKARILVALLGKQLGVTPLGWEVAAGMYALPGYRSIADVTDRRSLDRVRAYNREHPGA